MREKCTRGACPHKGEPWRCLRILGHCTFKSRFTTTFDTLRLRYFSVEWHEMCTRFSKMYN